MTVNRFILENLLNFHAQLQELEKCKIETLMKYLLGNTLYKRSRQENDLLLMFPENKELKARK